jgi:tetratricopeptide (TPR) repeat protein
MNYHRADVLRILRITSQQLSQWQRAGLAREGDLFSFCDLLQLKKIRDLRAKNVRPAVIRASLDAMMQQVAGMENPLLEAGTFPSKARVVFRHEGRALEPTTGQWVMDFGPGERVVSAKVRLMRSADTAGELFARGVSLEDDPACQSEAILCYRKVLEIEPTHAAAHINLGTIFYNQREFALAETHYRAAVEADPRYALAYFDLGNVLDETGRIREAIEVYKKALLLAPTYADVHYNLALAYEKATEARRALHHWQAYVKLDTSGPWSAHAQNQIRRILASDPLQVVYRSKL